MILGELAVGAVAGRSLWMMTRGLFGHPAFERHNYRDHLLPTAVGVLPAVVVAAVVALAGVVGSRPPKVLGWDTLVIVGPTLVGLAGGFALLGLIDDLGGVGQSGGFGSHLSALLHGRLTTGALLKLLGGPLIAVAMLAATPFGGSRVGLLRDAALICLAANLANLLDRAPGRTSKVAVASFGVLWAVTGFARIVSPVAVFVGALIGLIGPELRESFMLGDAGSNTAGASIGFAVVLVTTTTQRWWVLGVLAALNLLSERVSFSRIIDAVAPLRWLDRLGAPHRPFSRSAPAATDPEDRPT